MCNTPRIRRQLERVIHLIHVISFFGRFYSFLEAIPYSRAFFLSLVFPLALLATCKRLLSRQIGRPIGTYFCVTRNKGIPCVAVYRADDIIARSIMARDTRAFRTVTKYTRTQSVLFLLYLCSLSLTRCPWPRCSTSRFTDNEITSTAQKNTFFLCWTTWTRCSPTMESLARGCLSSVLKSRATRLLTLFERH